MASKADLNEVVRIHTNVGDKTATNPGAKRVAPIVPPFNRAEPTTQ
jgi:hypothetical protein